MLKYWIWWIYTKLANKCGYVWLILFQWRIQAPSLGQLFGKHMWGVGTHRQDFLFYFWQQTNKDQYHGLDFFLGGRLTWHKSNIPTVIVLQPLHFYPRHTDPSNKPICKKILATNQPRTNIMCWHFFLARLFWARAKHTHSNCSAAIAHAGHIDPSNTDQINSGWLVS